MLEWLVAISYIVWTAIVGVAIIRIHRYIAGMNARIRKLEDEDS